MKLNRKYKVVDVENPFIWGPRILRRSYTQKAKSVFLLFHEYLKRKPTNNQNLFFIFDSSFLDAISLAFFRLFFSGRNQQIAIRFSLVNEFRFLEHKFPRKFFAKVLSFLHQRDCIILAETREIANFLEEISNSPVLWAPTPVTFRTSARPGSQIAEFGLIVGSARKDKGYFLITSIADQLQTTHPNLKIVFQRMSSQNKYYDANYERELASFSNLVILREYLTPKVFSEEIESSSFILAPYDPKTFRSRGSSLSVTGASYKKPILTVADTSLGNLVSDFGIGLNYSTDLELVSSVDAILRRDISWGYQEYIEEVNLVNAKWLNLCGFHG